MNKAWAGRNGELDADRRWLHHRFQERDPEARFPESTRIANFFLDASPFTVRRSRSAFAILSTALAVAWPPRQRLLTRHRCSPPLVQSAGVGWGTPRRCSTGAIRTTRGPQAPDACGVIENDSSPLDNDCAAWSTMRDLPPGVRSGSLQHAVQRRIPLPSGLSCDRVAVSAATGVVWGDTVCGGDLRQPCDGIVCGQPDHLPRPAASILPQLGRRPA